ncbi:MAG: KpsF/GutQ family sugar-phosphate isomerase [Candidatus Brocadiaceae bacterium]|nr:KpsF/GutQ family sugar-phosphate isomerase [Candidatus Brocadiaceae bacterium]
MNHLDAAREIIRLEIKALEIMCGRLGEGFERAVELVAACGGSVVVTGVGKAGLIGRKISATLASTGTPSHWMHAVEARHGDLGRVRPEDVVLALSNSGETEVVQLLPSLKKLHVPLIALTGRPGSTLARHAEVVLDIGEVEEACPLGLAPSSSTTAMLVLGDALALTLFRMRRLRPEDYAFYHPGGELGRRLIKVREVMRRGARNPVASADVTVRAALKVMSGEGRPGAVSLVDEAGVLVGFFTDGDLRRLLEEDGAEVLERRVRDVMTPGPRTVSQESLVAEAYRMLRDFRIDQLPVVDGAGHPVGLIDVQDWLDIERGAAMPDHPPV